MSDLRSVGHLRPFVLVVASLTLAGLLLLGPWGADAGAKNKKKGPAPTPVVFVHGQSGSVQQFETSAMRFASNGFPRNRTFAYEYDTNQSTNDLAITNLDTFIANVMKKTKSDQVDVLAHSRGTTVMHAFLSTPERAGLVRRYVNFDGRSSDSPPGGVPTLAVWGEPFGPVPDTRAIVGARNVRYAEKSHTEVTTSRQAFGEVYKFLMGKRPKTKNVTPEPPGRVTVAGRALNFPANTAIEGGVFKAYEVLARTGMRKKGKPIYRKTLDATGNFGPFKVHGKKRYEFEVAQPNADATTIHNYPEPFERDDHFYRVLSAPALVPFLDPSPNHTNVAVTRMREFRGDQDPAGNDKLKLNGVNVINPAIAPRARRVLAVFNLDRGSDGVSDFSSSLFPFGSVSFLTGVDIFLQSSPDASETISVKEKMRDPGGQYKTINVPNWPSSEHNVSVFFRDYAAKSYKKPKCKKGKKFKKYKKNGKCQKKNRYKRKH